MRTLQGIVSIVAVFCPLAISTQAAPQKNPAAPQTAAKPAGSPAHAEGSRASGEQAAAKLPVRRVILYKTGVGYFEHLGHVRGSEAVRIDFTSVIFLQQKSTNPEIEAAFRKIVDQKNRVAALESQLSGIESEQQKIFDDQQRIRENLKALKGSAEERALTQRYTQQLEDQETRLQALQAKTADLESQRDKAQEDLDAMIENLDLGATL